MNYHPTPVYLIHIHPYPFKKAKEKILSPHLLEPCHPHPFITWEGGIFDKHLDRAWDKLWIKLHNGSFKAPQMKALGPPKIQISCRG